MHQDQDSKPSHPGVQLVSYVCPKCGGDDCGRDATASWDVQAQAFVLGTIYDQGWCNQCGDVDLVEVKMTDEVADLLKTIEAVMTAETGDLRALAEMCGCNPATFYVGTDMTGVDVSGQDLRGMAFTNLHRGNVRHDAATIFPDGTRGGEQSQAAGQ